MNNLYPLKLKGVSKSAIWGGRILSEKYGKMACGENIGESWELTCRTNEQSIIENGIYAGKTIGEYIKENGEKVISQKYKFDNFPLLIKLLNSASPLSVQVHPSDEYALINENEFGKTEMWYIMEAERDSELVIGVKDYNTKEFKNAAKAGKLEKYLCNAKVKPGDCYFIPSGLVHAIGKGILLCEIQQNSDVTYRVYDYNRTDKNGNTRELHIDKAAEVIKEYTWEEIDTASKTYSPIPVSDDAETLVSCDKFTTEKIVCKFNSELFCDDSSFLSLTCVKGNGIINFEGEQYSFSLGETYFIPAGMGGFSVSGDTEIICASVKR